MSAEFDMLLAEMQADFLDELPERCGRIEQGVLALERQQPDAFNELYRQVHSLKGTGGMFGVPVITTICHQFETFISEARTRFNQQASSTSLAYVDLLRKTAQSGGRDTAGVAAIEQVLDRLRAGTLSGRASVLLAEPSDSMRKLYREVFADKAIHLVTVDKGLAALERMLHESFDLLVASRELPDINAIAVLAALRDSDGRNKDIPAILISSNPAPVPKRLGVRAIVRRDPKLVPTLAQHVGEALAQPGRT
jgi:chemotaxis protein histidine kinase CheA